MSHYTILIPSDFTGESVGSSTSLVILSTTKEKVMAILVVLPEISPKAKAVVVACLLLSPPPASGVPPPDVPSPGRRSSLPAAASAQAVLSLVLADCLPPHNRFRGSPTISYKDTIVEAIVEPIVPSVHHGQTVEDMLDDQSEMIKGMYEHFLDMPLSKIKEIKKEL
ncbi:hypothetical protein Tco_0332980 [Tanacetum coccineum]